ncbi:MULTISPECIES: hypothetical protein [Burkholderia]|uniref:Uncharacterized protein n=1 Tax=Burkholderia pseudomallei TaxID=28450 RepID=A0A0C5B137_BURPE|nr:MULTISPECIES: hypothetical protein [Burkholderia]AJL34902.1 hypothetical protein pBPS019 [Burkholderia pseudomallei]KWK61850.1 hypothetical protein WM15_13010 [Burkholderia ubonensis]
MNQSLSYSVALPHTLPLHTQEPIRRAQIRVLLVTIVTDALSAWRRAPCRTWNDISRLVLRQFGTLDRLYPEAGILDTPLREVTVQFFAANVDASITGFGHREGDATAAKTDPLMFSLRVAAPTPMRSFGLEQ